MRLRYKDWLRNAAEQRSKLDRSLTDHGGSDVVVPYADVALAFPSCNPSPHTFDHPIIDFGWLKRWAESKDWQVGIAPEMNPEREHHPLVHFTRPA